MNKKKSVLKSNLSLNDREDKELNNNLHLIEKNEKGDSLLKKKDGLEIKNHSAARKTVICSNPTTPNESIIKEEVDINEQKIAFSNFSKKPKHLVILDKIRMQFTELKQSFIKQIGNYNDKCEKEESIKEINFLLDKINIVIFLFRTISNMK